MTEYPYYKFQEGGGRRFYEGRYWNANATGTCIVAAVTNNIDWAAYIGADEGWSEEACLQRAATFGAKLSEEDAKHFFPHIKLPYRR